MPLYVLKCDKCGWKVEMLISIEGRVGCPHCHIPMRRVPTTFSFRMKEGYPSWVDNLDTHQKKQADQGLEPDLPSFEKIK